MPSPHPPTRCIYVLKLLAPDPRCPGRLAGRLEHVDSGRRHDFGDAATLLQLLHGEQAAAGAPPAAEGR